MCDIIIMKVSHSDNGSTYKGYDTGDSPKFDILPQDFFLFEGGGGGAYYIITIDCMILNKDGLVGLLVWLS